MILSDFPFAPSPDAPRALSTPTLSSSLSATHHLATKAPLHLNCALQHPASAPSTSARAGAALNAVPAVPCDTAVPCAVPTAPLDAAQAPAQDTARCAARGAAKNAPVDASRVVILDEATCTTAPTDPGASLHTWGLGIGLKRDPLLERLFGPMVSAVMCLPNITEIMLNENGELLLEHKEHGMRHLGTMDAQKAQNAIRTLATLLGQDLNSACPILSGDIARYHARFEGLLPPLVKAPVFAIRRHQDQTRSVDDLIKQGSLNANQAQILRDALRAQLSILVSGATGTGKTSLVDTLLRELLLQRPDERIISIEDTKELSELAGNYVHLVGNGTVELTTLLRSALRLRPDRIVVGEVRGPEALDLVDALTTGHRGGLATVHAGSPAQALQRLSLLVSRNPSCPRYIEPMVASAIDLVIQTERRAGTRQVSEIAMCAGFHNGHFALIPVTTTLKAALDLRRDHERRLA